MYCCYPKIYFKGLLGEQRWRSGESTRLPPMWPGFDSNLVPRVSPLHAPGSPTAPWERGWFDSRSRRHMWVEFVAGSRLCSKGFSPPSTKTNISKFQFELETVERRATPWIPIIILFIYFCFFLCFGV